jgi:hypothetical protein
MYTIVVVPRDVVIHDIVIIRKTKDYAFIIVQYVVISDEVVI